MLVLRTRPLRCWLFPFRAAAINTSVRSVTPPCIEELSAGRVCLRIDMWWYHQKDAFSTCG